MLIRSSRTWRNVSATIRKFIFTTNPIQTFTNWAISRMAIICCPTTQILNWCYSKLINLVPKIVINLLYGCIFSNFRGPCNGIFAFLTSTFILLFHKIIFVFVRQIVIAWIIVQWNGQRCRVIHMLQWQRVAHLQQKKLNIDIVFKCKVKHFFLHFYHNLLLLLWSIIYIHKSPFFIYTDI